MSCELLHKVPKLAVLAVEPQPAVYELLRENLAQFGDRARCVCAAMPDRGGQATMRINSQNLGGSCITGQHEATAHPIDQVTVEMRTAPEILDEGEFDRLDMVKIDVEGPQYQVLMSLAPALDQFRPRVILFEHDGALCDRSDPVRSCFDTLGYRIEGIVKRLNGWITVAVDSPEARVRKFNDYIAVPA